MQLLYTCSLFLLSHLFYISNYCVKETVLQVVVDRLIDAK